MRLLRAIAIEWYGRKKLAIMKKDRTMKKNMSGPIIFGMSTFLILFLYIWHHNTRIKLVYRKQRAEKQFDDLSKEKERLNNALLTAQNPHEIKKRAKQLGMVPTKLDQITSLEKNNGE